MRGVYLGVIKPRLMAYVSAAKEDECGISGFSSGKTGDCNTVSCFSFVLLCSLLCKWMKQCIVCVFVFLSWFICLFV